MNNKEILDEIENIAFDVCALISVTRDACETNNYVNEEITLSYALKLQHNIIEKLFNMNINN